MFKFITKETLTRIVNRFFGNGFFIKCLFVYSFFFVDSKEIYLFLFASILSINLHFHFGILYIVEAKRDNPFKDERQ